MLRSLVIVAVALVSWVAADAAFQVDPSIAPRTFPHYWEQCVGSCHALMGLRADWRAQMTQSARELGWKMVRFHGLFDDDMSVLLQAPTPSGGQWQISMFNVFAVFDFLRSINMRPFVELSFMPEALASSSATIFHYKGNISPPRDWNLWASFIQQVVQALVDRYGIEEVAQWAFEVWNEPNCGFWSGTIDQYFTLLNYTYRAVKAVSPRLRVGGPATCQSGYIRETVAYCNAQGIKLDFISTHEYPTDIMPVARDIMARVVAQARKDAAGLPVYYTEFNDGLWYGGEQRHDTPYASAFIVQNVADLDGQLDVLSWWTFSDLFEEGGFQPDPFWQETGWGLLDNYGIAKPSYRAYQMLHAAGNMRLNVTGTHPTVGVLASTTAASGSATLQFILYNHDVPTQPPVTQTVTVTVSGVASRTTQTKALTRYVDDTHANAPALWRGAMKKPMYPTADQLAQLTQASQVTDDSVSLTRSGNDLQFTITLPPEGIASVYVPLS